MITAAPVVEKRESPRSPANKEPEHAVQLAPRQDPLCTTVYRCGLCATPTAYPCLDIAITGAGDFYNNEWDGRIIEDGTTTCSASIQCDDCQGLDDWADCGNGNRWKFTDNEVWYHSGKYDADFNFFLPETRSEEFDCGPG
ncbi:hypothetical protein N0V90_002091, partial [Kalmusia sp. IMI 367209]